MQLQEKTMSAVSPTIPSPLQSSRATSTENVINKMHHAIAQAQRSYNANISWLREQIAMGNLDKDTLAELICKPTHNQTHQSPIEKAIDKRYVDPQMIAITDNTQTNAPNHMMHQAAKLLTLKSLTLADFPPICQTETQNITAAAP